MPAIQSTAPVSDHLVFFIHGMGQQRGEYGHLDHHVSTMQRNTDHLLRIFYPDKRVRVKYVAIEWHSKIQDKVADRIALSTLKTVPKVRLMTNEWLADVLFYFTKPHGQDIISTICDQLIEAYNQYTMTENPEFCFNRGQVHIVGFSLGGICAYDILANQPSAPSTSAALNNSGFIVPALPFVVNNLFTAGSPIAATLIARNQTYGTYSLPESTRFHNIFHPFDPLGYRIEPMMDERYVNVPPVALERLGRRRFLPVSVSLPNLSALRSIPGAARPLIMQARRSFFKYMTTAGTLITSTEEETIVEERTDEKTGRPITVFHRRNSNIVSGQTENGMRGKLGGVGIDEQDTLLAEREDNEIFEGMYVEEETTTRTTADEGAQMTKRKTWIGSFYRPKESVSLLQPAATTKRPVSPQSSQESDSWTTPSRRRLNLDGNILEYEKGGDFADNVLFESPESSDTEGESGRRTPQPRESDKPRSTILGMAGSVAGSVASGMLSVVRWPGSNSEKSSRTMTGSDSTDSRSPSLSVSPPMDSSLALFSSSPSSDSDETETDISFSKVNPTPTTLSHPPNSPTHPTLSRTQSLDSIASFTTAIASPRSTPRTAASRYDGHDFPEIELGASFLGELDGPILPSPRKETFSPISTQTTEDKEPPIPREETEDWTRRADYVLTEGYVDSYANEWIVALKSHFRYWANRDFTYHIIKTMVGSRPTVPVVGMDV